MVTYGVSEPTYPTRRVSTPHGAFNELIYVHQVPLPGSAANTVQVAKMCDAFIRAGAKTTLVQPAPPTDAGHRLAAFYGLSHPPKVAAGFAPKLPGRMLMFGLSACLRHACRRHSLIYTRSISVAYVAARLGYNVAIEMHEPLWGDKPNDRKRFEKLIQARAFTSLVVISEKLADWYAETCPALAGRIIVAHDGADPVTKPASPLDLKGDFRIGYTGHLYPGKGMELIAAIAPLLPDAQLHVVGGRPEDISYWQDELAKVGTGENITFHGHRPHSEVAGYIEAMDIVLAPYLRFVQGLGGKGRNLSDWMSPLKLFEYMGHGKAIVCSDLPVLREVLTDGVNARLANPDAPEEWVSAIRALHSSPETRVALGARARVDFVEKYSWDRRAEHILDGLRMARTPAAEVSRGQP